MSAQDIEDELERTRSELDSTLHELEHRLAPGPIMETIIESARSGTLADRIAFVTDRVKANPFAAALVGFGVGWLMLSSRAPGAGIRKTAPADETAGESFREHAARIGDGEEAAARGRLGRYGDMARRGGAQAQDTVASVVNTHPFATGLMAIAAGAALGALLPRTRREDEWMGESRDELAEQARELGRQEVDRAKRAAQSAAEAAQEQAHREGLDSEGAREQWEGAKEKAEHVVEAAKEAARDEAKR